MCTEVWKLLGKTSGTGLYNRCAAGDGGQAAGTAAAYDVTVTRTSGKASGHVRSSSGNDGTFSVSPASSPCRSARRHSQGHRHAGGRRPQRAAAPGRRETLGVDGSMMVAVVAGERPSAPAYSHDVGTSARNERPAATT